ncbi:signal peptide protein [Rhodopirellula maiorica SM1]|uniref:Signal peptide protein n=1 Tax=Rhodopirellula maiorica SM1 TaxID=1265738 RepID=M5RCS3_9BACT|nr:hypothetical protein [Rhodopirellula maiorica]EMI16856.1 signal peptide protein [Rhodopirellula maiorica SM1]
MSNSLRDDHALQAAESTASSNPKGCWFYGCLAGFFFFTAAVGCVAAGAYWLYMGQVEKFTATAPVELPTVEYAPEQYKELEAEIETFKQSLEVPEPEIQYKELVLTARDINALISRDESLRGKLHIEIVEGQVVGDVSVPTDMLPGGEGRYFNAKAHFDVSLEEGLVVIKLIGAEVKGSEVPQTIVDAMAGENLAKDLYENPETAKWLSRFEQIEFEDDRVRLRVRTDTPNEENPTDETPVEQETVDAADGEAGSDTVLSGLQTLGST